MASTEEFIKAMESEDPDAAVTSILEAHNKELGDRVAAAVSGKNKELLGKLDKVKPWRELEAETGKTAAEIRAELEAAQAAKDEAEAKGAGVDLKELDRMSEEKAAAKLASVIPKHEALLQQEREARKTAEESLKAKSAKLLAEQIERRLYRAASNDVEPDLWSEFVARLAPCYAEDDNGDLILVDPTTKTPLPGADGLMTDAELVDQLFTSTGNEKWNSKGRKFFKPSRGDGHRENRTSPGTRAVRKKRSDMTRAEKSAFIAAHGNEEFQGLPA